MPAVWWVNQAEPQHSVDLKRGYRWSPSRDKRGAVLEPWRCLEDMAVGDIWINYSKPRIVSLSAVTCPPEFLPRPADQTAPSWEDEGGCRVWFEDFTLSSPIDVKGIPDEWKRKAGPFRSNLWVKLSSVETVDPVAAEELRAMFADRWPEESPWAELAAAATDNHQTRYWLNIHTPESWERFSVGDIDVVTSKLKSPNIRRGDIFINFVSGDGARWVSAEEVVSDVRPLLNKPYQDYDSQWEWEIRPLTKRLSLDEGIVVRSKTQRLDLFRGYERNWGVRVRKSGAELTEHDAELIIGWIDPPSRGAR